MNNRSIISLVFLFSLFFLPTISTGTANNTPNYVGIGSTYKDYYIYNTDFDKDPYEDYLEDLHLNVSQIENITDEMFDDEFREKVKKWIIFLEEIGNEKDMDDVGYVKCKYQITTEDKNGQYAGLYKCNDYLFEYDRDFYVDLVWYESGLFFLFVANDVKWNQLADQVDEEWGDDFDGDHEKASAEVEKSWSYLEEKANGISTSWNPDERDLEDLETISIYNDDGVLMYYEWTYDGDTILKLELTNRFAHEYWWLFVSISIAGTVVVAILTFTIISNKKPMMIILMGCVFVVIFLVIGQAFIIYNLMRFGRYL